jgi:hypothetical protein
MNIDYHDIAALQQAARRERARAVHRMIRSALAALVRMGTSPRGLHVQGRAAQG